MRRVRSCEKFLSVCGCRVPSLNVQSCHLNCYSIFFIGLLDVVVSVVRLLT